MADEQPKKKDSFDRLDDFLGYDATADTNGKILSGVVGEALTELDATDRLTAKAKVKEILIQAKALSKKRKAAWIAFKKEEAVWDKELGKMLSVLEGYKKGDAQPTDQPTNETPANNEQK